MPFRILRKGRAKRRADTVGSSGDRPGGGSNHLSKALIADLKAYVDSRYVQQEPSLEGLSGDAARGLGQPSAGQAVFPAEASEEWSVPPRDASKERGAHPKEPPATWSMPQPKEEKGLFAAQRMQPPEEDFLHKLPTSQRGAAQPLPASQRGAARPLSASRRGAAQPLPAARQRSLAQVMEEVGENFQQRLLRLIGERDLTNAEVYKKANLDRKLFSKILCSPAYHPGKHTVLSLAIALELNLDETKDLLARAEYALSPGSKFDLVVEYFIVHGIYDVFTINTALFDYGQPLLGE